MQVAQRREAGEYHIELDTPITLPGPVDAHQCLEFNARTIIGMLCMVDDELFYKRVVPLRHLDVPSLDAALREAAGASALIERAIPAGEPF